MELTLDTLIRDVKDSSADPLVQLESASRTAAAPVDLLRGYLGTKGATSPSTSPASAPSDRQ